MEAVTYLAYWHWLVLGLSLIIFEIIAPTAVFLWFAVAAVIVGLILLFFPDVSWETQVMLFSILSIAAVIAWRLYIKKYPPADNQYPTLNKRGEDLVGRVFTLQEDIVDNYGKIRVDDTMWKIRGADITAGKRVRVVEVDGTVLVVRPEN